MKHKIKHSLTLLSTTVFAHGAIISVDNIDPTFGTFSNFTSTASNANTFVLTRDFDFDSGGISDTLTFTLTRNTYNGTASITDSNVTVGTLNTGGNATNWYSNFGNLESLQLVVSDITYTSGEMDGTTAVFTGFTNATRTNINNAGDEIDYLIHTGPIGSTTFTSTGTSIDLTSAGTSDTLFITAESGAPGIRIRDLDLRFETVIIPEPSSIALLGLGGLALIFRRRK